MRKDGIDLRILPVNPSDEARHIIEQIVGKSSFLKGDTETVRHAPDTDELAAGRALVVHARGGVVVSCSRSTNIGSRGSRRGDDEDACARGSCRRSRSSAPVAAFLIVVAIDVFRVGGGVSGRRPLRGEADDPDGLWDNVGFVPGGIARKLTGSTTTFATGAPSGSTPACSPAR